MEPAERWPSLPWTEWADTCQTLQLWTQMVGKVKLRLAPFLNEYWHVALFVGARGLTSGAVPYGAGAFTMDFDFVDHNLYPRTSDGQTKALPLIPRSVAEFYREFTGVLRALDIDVAISARPDEIPNAIPFDEDEVHGAYDPPYVARWWRLLLQASHILNRYRSSFVGKSSPVQFFWGSFDLTATRFSGRPAPALQGAPKFMQRSEDQENVACGFWPGNTTMSGVTLDGPAFYAYIYPEPPGFKDASIRPASAHYHAQMGCFVLPYEEVRRSAEPEQAILDFFQSAYEAAATLANWDRKALERNPG